MHSGRARGAPTSAYGVHQAPRCQGLQRPASGGLFTSMPLARIEPFQIFIASRRFDARGLGGGLGLEIIAAGLGRAALPVGQIGIRAAFAGAHGGAIDRFLKAMRQLHLGSLAAAFDDDLRGDVAPGNDDQRMPCVPLASTPCAAAECDRQRFAKLAVAGLRDIRIAGPCARRSARPCVTAASLGAPARDTRACGSCRSTSQNSSGCRSSPRPRMTSRSKCRSRKSVR